MPMGPWTSGERPPETPGIYATRGEGEQYDWWRLWDGAHWSRGMWTLLIARLVYGRLLQSGARMRREQRTQHRVLGWRALIEEDDDATA